MKTLNIPFDEQEFEALKLAKEEFETEIEHSISWKYFILKSIVEDYEVEE